MTLALLFNISLLVTLSAAHEFLLRVIPPDRGHLRNLGCGLLFGGMAILCITFPAEVIEGVRLDGRSVVLALGGYFLAPSSSVLALALAVVYRLGLGGEGAEVGCLNMATAMALGLVFRELVRRKRLETGARTFLLFSVSLHLLNLLWIYLFLNHLLDEIFKFSALVLLGIMTPALLVACLLMQTLQRQRHLAQALAHSESLRRAITEASPDVLLVLDEDGRYLEVVSPEERLLYTPVDRLLGRTIHEVMPQEDADKYLGVIRTAIHTNLPQHLEYTLETLGGLHVFEGTAQHLNFRANGKRTALFVANDITLRVKAEEALRIAAIAFEAQQGMVIADSHSTILKVNTTFCETLGYLPEDLIGQPTSILRSGHQDHEYYRAMWQRMSEHGQWEGEIWDRHKNGTLVPLWMTLKAVKTPEGQVTHYVAATTDISNRKAMEHEIHALAFYDQLTSLPNRRLFLDRMRQALARTHRNQLVAAVLYLDLDGFKQVNDLLGHHAGDQLLVQVGQRLQGVVRESDTVARLGGDEFVLLQELATTSEATAHENAAQVASKILHILSLPFDLEGHPAQVGASIGVALLTPDTPDIDTVLGQADNAMYMAKAEGKGRACFFTPVQGQGEPPICS